MRYISVDNGLKWDLRWISDMFDLFYLAGKSSMILAQSVWELPSSGIKFITCSTCSVGNSPHRW